MQNIRQLIAAAVVAGLSGTTALGQQVLHVRADAPPGGNGFTWETALTRVDIAMQRAQAGASIWVARGTYRPANAGGFLVNPSVTLLGGFAGNETSADQRDAAANPTILSGDLLDDDDMGGGTSDNGRVLVVSSGAPVIDGFTIRSGRGNPSYLGGGMHIEGSPVVRNCVFTRNGIDATAAVFIVRVGPAPYPQFINCTFVRNGFAGNPTNGVLYIAASSGATQLFNCAFVGNHGGNSSIIGVSDFSGLTASNCTVIGNSISSGTGVIRLGQWSITLNLINCTIAGNASINAGVSAGIYANTAASQIHIRNCVLWANTVPGAPVERAQFYFGPPQQAYPLDYCRVQGWSGTFPGKGTSGADPVFVDLDGPDDIPGTGDENFRLLPGSSCIDAGNNFYVQPDIADLDHDGDTCEPVPLDLDGNPRFLDDYSMPDTGIGRAPIVDIGAYEREGHSQPCSTDFNGDGVVNSQDVFDFLSAFFGGCQ